MASTEKQAVLRQIAQLGNPILRKKAREVSITSQKEIQNIINDLLVTVKDTNIVGISAPQIYESLRIFIVTSYPNPRYPNAPKMRPTPIINPKILSKSKDKVKDWEGCLSIPGIRGLVPRHKSIEVEFFTRKGNQARKYFKDFIARIFQHEYDHLEGIVFLDRMESMKDIITEKEFQRLMKEK